MTDKPTLRVRLAARLHGEKSAEAVDAYHRAGGDVYALVNALDEARSAWATQGVNAWMAPKSTQTGLLAGW